MSQVETEIWPLRDRDGTPPATAIGRVLRVPSRSPSDSHGSSGAQDTTDRNLILDTAGRERYRMM